MHILLNWLAHGSVVALVTAAGLRMLRRAPAADRERLCWTALGMLLALPLVPMASALDWAQSAPQGAAAGDATAGVAGAAVRQLLVLPAAFAIAPYLLGVCWMVWIAASGVRVLRDVQVLGRARARCRPWPEAATDRLTTQTRQQLADTGAHLVLSSDIRAAAVLGGRPALIAVHPSLLDTLSTHDLNAVLAHELAHVARGDRRALAVQCTIDLLAGWHPVVRWAGRRLRLEREMACDELAAAASSNRKAYAACLARLAEITTPRREATYALAMVTPSGLRARVEHLLEPRRWPPRAGRAVSTTWGAVLVGAALVAGSVAIFEASAAPARQGQDGRSTIGTAAPMPFDRDSAAPPMSATLSAEPRVADRLASPDAAGRAAAGATPGRTPVAVPEARSQNASAAAAPDASPEDGAVSDHQTVSSRPAAPLAAMPLEIRTPAPEAAAATVPEAPDETGPGSSGAAAAGSATLVNTATALAATTANGAGSTWQAASDTGTAIGRGSKRNAVATAAAFTRFGRRIASSF